MILEEIKTDLFKYEPITQNFYYAHCISRDFALGMGIAKPFRSKFNLTKDVLTQGMIFDNISLVSNVFNLITKSKYWQKPTYDSLKNSLLNMKKIILILNGNDTKKYSIDYAKNWLWT